VSFKYEVASHQTKFFYNLPAFQEIAVWQPMTTKLLTGNPSKAKLLTGNPSKAKLLTGNPNLAVI